MHQRTKNIALAGLAALSIGAAPAPAPSPPPSARTTAQGVYTADQAFAGATLYAVHCAMCHGQDQEGTFEVPPLKGKFTANWGHAPIGALFDYMSKAMPQFAPGALSAEDNTNLLAFLLKANGMPAATRALPVEKASLDAITFVPPPPAR